MTFSQLADSSVADRKEQAAVLRHPQVEGADSIGIRACHGGDCWTVNLPLKKKKKLDKPATHALEEYFRARPQLVADAAQSTVQGQHWLDEGYP